MCKFFLKFLFVSGLICVATSGFSATVESDTISSRHGFVHNMEVVHVFRLKDAKHAYSKSPSLEILRGTDAKDGVIRMSYDTIADSRRFMFEHKTGKNDYDPIVFKASDYLFDFASTENPVLTVNGKINCKEELRVVEVNSDQINSKEINAKEINVALNQAADYVFDEQYALQPLNEVEAYVRENKHLPGVPSATEFSEKGMNVSEMSNLLLEKVEELTLHLIQMQKEMEVLKAKNEALEKMVKEK